MQAGTNTEKKTIGKMIEIYCREKHFSKKGICNECSELYEYAIARLTRCPFGEEKPVCSECKVHCYKPEMRERVKSVMRFSGPRMIFSHPILAIRHILHKKFNLS
jgi:hypothetical protein